MTPTFRPSGGGGRHYGRSLVSGGSGAGSPGHTPRDLVSYLDLLSEIVVGTVAQLVIAASFGFVALGGKAPWIAFLAGTGAIVLTFLAGTELDIDTFRAKWKEAAVIGLIGFFAPFLGCTAVAYYILGWTIRGGGGASS